MANTNHLVYAAGKGYLQDVQNFAKSTPINSIDDMKNTALHLAAGAGHLSVVEFLLKQKGVHLDVQNNVGDTPLHKAVWRDNAEVVNKLLHAGAKTNIKNKSGKLAGDLSRSKEVGRLFDKDVEIGGESDSD